MVPKDFYEKFRASPVGKFIDRLIVDEVARGGDTSTPGGHGSVIDQIYYLNHTKRPDKAKTKFD